MNCFFFPVLVTSLSLDCCRDLIVVLADYKNTTKGFFFLLFLNKTLVKIKKLFLIYQKN